MKKIRVSGKGEEKVISIGNLPMKNLFFFFNIKCFFWWVSGRVREEQGIYPIKEMLENLDYILRKKKFGCCLVFFFVLKIMKTVGPFLKISK